MSGNKEQKCRKIGKATSEIYLSEIPTAKYLIHIGRKDK